MFLESLTAAFLVSALIFRQLHKNSQLLFAVAGDDSDMKIVPEGTRISPMPDRSEEAAAEYLAEKNNGNIAIAKKLGAELAEMMTKACDTADTMQAAALIFFAVLQAIDESSPTVTVATTVRATMFDVVKETNSDIYGKINDPGAFSLFILTSRGEQSLSYGDIYAKCYGKEHDELKIQEGNEIFCHWNEIAKAAVNNAGFHK